MTDTDRTLRVTVSRPYGREVIRPANALAETFCAIAGTTTLTPDMIRHIRALGYTVESVAPPV